MAITGVAVLALVLVIWLIGKSIGRYNVIDVGWGLGFVVIAWVDLGWSAGHGDTVRRTVVTVLVSVWGLRLATYIGLRSRGRGEDPRYAELLATAPRNPDLHALVVVYLTQALAMWFVSLPVQVSMFERGPTSALTWIGVAVWVVGFFFESVGDGQLDTFRRDPESRSKVMDRGLWRYTRHPNYFGDACQWWGLFLVAAQQLVGACTILSPVVMTYTLTSKTGKPTLEKGMEQRRPGYTEYVARTSGFFPLPPRVRG